VSELDENERYELYKLRQQVADAHCEIDMIGCAPRLIGDTDNEYTLAGRLMNVRTKMERLREENAEMHRFCEKAQTLLAEKRISEPITLIVNEPPKASPEKGTGALVEDYDVQDDEAYYRAEAIRDEEHKEAAWRRKEWDRPD